MTSTEPSVQLEQRLNRAVTEEWLVHSPHNVPI